MATPKNAKSGFTQREEEILKFWQDNKIFEKSLEKKSPKGDYVFYDGPPFATGTPHYGHVVASLMKDAVPRYWTMKGYHVERKWGWDCHGLPVENLIEQELKLKSKKDIETMGVEKFNQACESSVLRYADVWKNFIPRMGRWVDMENDYRTMDLNYMESIWWVFKSLWDKGLVYEGHKAMHICPRCETTLSNFEVTQGYVDLEDISVTAKFKLLDEPNTYILAWTTTPWTLPGNVALAVGENIDYVKIKLRNENLILAKALLENNVKEGYELIDEFKGEKLLGKKYEPLFDYYKDVDIKNKENGWKVYPANFVSTEDGTGVVHIAPAYGEEDMELGKEFNLPFIQNVDQAGRYTKEVKDWAGEWVKPKGDYKKGEHLIVDEKVVKWLEENKKLFSQAKYTHSYPLCWRCDTPLLNYATSSWFVRVEKIKDNMLKNNGQIHWVPENIKLGRFGKWLENARDWSISRNRYWGSPLPVWKCKCKEIKVIGSIEELEKLSGQKITNLHKHVVDKITFKCEKCNGEMKRIEEVLDCWFESGSMPYAQMHYPFENKKKFEDNFPAQFIAEGVDQTRGWFYTLIVLSSALFGKPAFLNCIVNGTVLAENGQKMSKRLKNYPEPDVLIDKFGADSMRYYLITSPVMRAEDLCFSEKGVDEVLKKLVMILMNVVSFYKMYADEKIQPSADSKNVLDKWILAKLQLLLKEVTEAMDAYDLVRASRPIQDFITELSTWYVRRSRDRFKGEDEKDKKQALQTLHYVLLELAKIIAPFTPFLAEMVYREVNHEVEARLPAERRASVPESVHLESWPLVDEKSINEKILNQMDLARKIVEAGLAARAQAGIKIRQPLISYSTSLTKKLDNEFIEMVQDELNIKSLLFGEDLLNTEINEDLKLEGIARELVRNINQERKNQGFTIKDKASVLISSDNKDILATIEKYKDQIQKDTISEKIDIAKVDSGVKTKINGIEIDLKLEKI